MTRRASIKYIDNKRKMKGNVGLLHNELMLPLPQSLLATLGFSNPRYQRPGRKAGGRNMYPWWKRTYLRGQGILKLDILKSMSLDEMHP